MSDGARRRGRLTTTVTTSTLTSASATRLLLIRPAAHSNGDRLRRARRCIGTAFWACPFDIHCFIRLVPPSCLRPHSTDCGLGLQPQVLSADMLRSMSRCGSACRFLVLVSLSNWDCS